MENAKNGALKTLDIIEEAVRTKQMKLSQMELDYIPVLRDELLSIPNDESQFVDMMLPLLDQKKFLLKEYGL